MYRSGRPIGAEVLDGRLEARFPREDEHGHRPKAQAKPGDLTEGVGVHVGPLEPGGVVELGVGGQVDFPLVGDEGASSKKVQANGLGWC